MRCRIGVLRRADQPAASWLGGKSMFLGRIGRPAHMHRQAAWSDELRCLKRERRAAKCAFRHRTANIPMGPTAARAMVGLMLAINDVIPPIRRVVGVGLARIDHTHHGYFLLQLVDGSTWMIAKGFIGCKCAARMCECAHRG